MANPQPTPPPPEDLDSRVDALLKDIHETTDLIETALTPDVAPERGPSAKPGPGIPATSSDAGAGVEPADTSRDLDAQIATLLKSVEHDPASSGTVAPAPAEPAANSADEEKDIGALDADLARLTDSILKNNAPLPEVAPDPAPGLMASAGKPAPGPQNVGAGSAGEDDLLSAPAVKHGPLPRPVPGRAGAENTPGAGAGSDTAPISQRMVASIGPGVAKIGASVGRMAAPVVLTAMAAASAPLAGRPKVVRDTVGWLAMWTAFVSVSLWTYLLFFHKPEVPRTDSAPIEFVGQMGKARPEQAVATAPTDERSQSGATHEDAPAKGEH